MSVCIRLCILCVFASGLDTQCILCLWTPQPVYSTPGILPWRTRGAVQLREGDDMLLSLHDSAFCAASTSPWLLSSACTLVRSPLTSQQGRELAPVRVPRHRQGPRIGARRGKAPT